MNLECKPEQPYFTRDLTIYYARPSTWAGTRAESNDLAWLMAVFQRVDRTTKREAFAADGVVLREFQDTKTSADAAVIVFETLLDGKPVWRIEGNACRGLRLIPITMRDLHILTFDETLERDKEGIL